MADKSRNGHIHPDSPAGGTGTGFSRMPGSANNKQSNSNSWSSWFSDKCMTLSCGTVTNWISDGFEIFPQGKVKSNLLELLGRLFRKDGATLSTALFMHYIEGSGDVYELKEIPLEWKAWIAKITGGKPGRYRMDPYNKSKIYDLIYSLGHFDVTVSRRAGGATRTYFVEDIYQFEFSENAKGEMTRHGFETSDMSEDELRLAQSMLPTKEYVYPNGFKERWQLKRNPKTGKVTPFIPHDFLLKNGKAFKVQGKFEK